MAEKSPTPKSPHVPEQYRGFSLQPTRMAELLLKSPQGSLVSLELFDDVGLETPDGAKRAIQTKSVRASNPISDRSPELWKTFANWTRDVMSGALDPNTTLFEIYINKKLSGKLAIKFSEAKTKSEAKEAFEEARSLLWGVGPKFEKRSDVAESLVPHLNEVFGSGFKAFLSIIPRFSICFAKRNPISDIHDIVSGWATVKEEHVVDIVLHLHGWIKEKVDAQLESGKTPTISRDDCFRELQSYYGKLVPSGVLPDVATKPTSEDVQSHFNFNFVKQLRIINEGEHTIIQAINTYFMAKSARIMWSERGAVHDSSMSELEDTLIGVFNNQRTRIFLNSSYATDIDKARVLHAECQIYNCKVEGKDVPSYFIPGCFQSLANSLVIGWHPSYEELMGKS